MPADKLNYRRIGTPVGLNNRAVLGYSAKLSDNGTPCKTAMMQRTMMSFACLWAGAACLWAAPSLGDSHIYVYQANYGSHLVTDHVRIETSYPVIKIYQQSDPSNQTVVAPPGVFRPKPSLYDGLIKKAAGRVHLDPLLIKSVIHAESGFDPNAVSSRGARGLMQLMPATARRYGVFHVFDPHENIMGGARYLSDLLDRFDGNLQLALAGYNAGENAVVDTGGIPPYDETRRYVKKVVHLYRKYTNGRCRQRTAHPGFVTVIRGTTVSCSGPGP